MIPLNHYYGYFEHINGAKRRQLILAPTLYKAKRLAIKGLAGLPDPYGWALVDVKQIRVKDGNIWQ
jgi:hypothetical protein